MKTDGWNGVNKPANMYTLFSDVKTARKNTVKRF
jgi:hypothetical protein